MKTRFTWLLMLMMLFAVGCGSPGGSEGDTNDPETSGSDEEQMNDETGDMEE